MLSAQQDDDVPDNVSSELSEPGDLQDTSTASSDVDMDDATFTYTINDEEYPTHAAYDKDAIKLKNDLDSILRTLIAITSDKSTEHSELRRLNEKIVELRESAFLPPPKIVLLGDAGVGKSSVINALLHIPSIAKTGAVGDSCTAVTTEFRDEWPEQVQQYMAVIHYREEREIKDFLKLQIQAYQDYHFVDHEGEEPDMLDAMRQEAETCRDVFLTLFGDRDGFRSKAEVHDSIRNSFHEDPETVEGMDLLITLAQSCEALIQARLADSARRYSRLEATTTDDLEEALEPFCEATQDLQGLRIWPLVKKVTIGVKNNRILKHISIVDLPGISDHCQVRSNACHDALRECDAIWIVGKVDRVATDKTVDTLIQRYKERFGGRVAVICTRSDDLAIRSLDSIASDLKKRGQNMRHFNSLKQQHREATTRYKTLSKKKRPTTAEEGERQDLRTEIEKLNLQRFTAVITARNTYVEDKLQEKESKLQVFCVSNTHYESSCEESDTPREPILSITKSGIPALRNYALTVPADAAWDHLQNLVYGDFRLLLRGLELWVQRKPIHNPAQLVRIFNVTKEGIQVLVAELKGKLHEATESNLRLLMDASINTLQEKALRLLPIWKTWNVRSLQAFVRRDGKSSKSMVVQGSWNEELLSAVKDSVDKAWSQLASAREASVAAFTRDMSRLIEAIATSINERPDTFGIDPNILKDLIGGLTCAMRHKVKKFTKEYQKEDLNIKQDTLEDEPTNFLVLVLSDTVYKGSRNDSGKGWLGRWHVRFLTFVTKPGDGNPFRIWAKSTIAAVEKNLEGRISALSTALEKEMTDFAEQFERRCNSKKPDDPATEKARGLLGAYLPQARVIFEEAQTTMTKLNE